MIRGEKQLRHRFLTTDTQKLIGNYCNLLKHVLSSFARMGKEQPKQKKRKTKIGSELKLLGCRPIKGVVCGWLLFRGTCILNLDDTSKTYGPHKKRNRLNGYGLLKTLYYYCHFQFIFSFSFCHVKVQATRKYIPRDIVALFLFFFFNTGKHHLMSLKLTVRVTVYCAIEVGLLMLQKLKTVYKMKY